jgi:hypothetical protein
MYVTIQRTIQSQKVWVQLDDRIEIAQSDYQSHTWDETRRLIMVRQKVSKRPKATGKVLRLFEDDEIINGYRHSCYITTCPYHLQKSGGFIETEQLVKTE